MSTTPLRRPSPASTNAPRKRAKFADLKELASVAVDSFTPIPAVVLSRLPSPPSFQPTPAVVITHPSLIPSIMIPDPQDVERIRPSAPKAADLKEGKAAEAFKPCGECDDCFKEFLEETYKGDPNWNLAKEIETHSLKMLEQKYNPDMIHSCLTKKDYMFTLCTRWFEMLHPGVLCESAEMREKACETIQKGNELIELYKKDYASQKGLYKAAIVELERLYAMKSEDLVMYEIEVMQKLTADVQHFQAVIKAITMRVNQYRTIANYVVRILKLYNK